MGPSNVAAGLVFFGAAIVMAAAAVGATGNAGIGMLLLVFMALAFFVPSFYADAL